MIYSKLATVATAIAAMSMPALAQGRSVQTPDRARVSGLVLRADSGRAPIKDAEVIVAALGERARTTEEGRFLLLLAPGEHRLEIRAVGFLPVRQTIVAFRGDTTTHTFSLQLVAILPPVDVKAREQTRDLVDGRVQTMHLIARSEFERRSGRPIGDVLMRIPGVRIQRRGLSEAYVLSGRGRSTIRGNNPNCFAQVYLDGAVVYSGDPQKPFNVNTLNTAEIQEVHYYASGAMAPPKYNRTGSSCGVLLIWTRNSS